MSHRTTGPSWTRSQKRTRQPTAQRLFLAPFALALVASLAVGACGSSDKPTSPEGYLSELRSTDDIVALSAGDYAVKYLAPLEPGEFDEPLDNACVFQDMTRHEWHVTFLTEFDAYAHMGFETYVDYVLRRATRIMWGGAVRWWPEAVHPRSGLIGVVSFSIYAEDSEGNSLTPADVEAVHRRMLECTAFPSEMLVFLAEGSPQIEMIAAQAPIFDAMGIAVSDGAGLAGGLAEVYSAGVGYGTLQIVRPGATLSVYGLRDILVLESAPNDIGVIGGLVTSQPQNLHSHVNLRLDEKDIPNVRLPNAPSDVTITGLAGSVVRLAASVDGVELREATLEEAEAWWAQHRPDVGQPSADLSVTSVQAFDVLDATDADSYGAKASNLAELAALLAPEHAQEGLAIPFSAYVTHIERNSIDALVEDVLADSRVLSDTSYRARRLDDIRDAIRDAPVDPALLEELEAQIRALLGDAAETTKLRFRSSTNVEDLASLTGAGLYDSRSGCLGDDLDGDLLGPSRCLSTEEEAWLRAELERRLAELRAHPDRFWVAALIGEIEEDLSEERPIARALPRVWRSLWNDLAWEEREYYGIDHRLAYMGVAVHPSFALEQVNAVVVTNVPNGDRAPLYRVVSQVGWESVVRPADPTARAELRTVERDVADQLLNDQTSHLSTLNNGDALWADDTFSELMRVVFVVHDHFTAEVYADPTMQLDLEVKLTRGGEVIVKQVRPYVGGSP